MIDDNELKEILRNAIKEAGNNISQWARENGLFTQRGNINEIAYGERKVSERVAKALGYKRTTKIWVIKKPGKTK